MLVNLDELEKYKSSFDENGFFIVKNGFTQRQIALMKKRLGKIISGEIQIKGRRFQEDTKTGLYEDVGKIELGYKGPNTYYRKISDLEYDELFLKMIQSEWIKVICNKFIGPQSSIMRVTMMDKPPNKGTILPWHQDVSVNWPTSVQPKFAIWFCLDKTSSQKGSLEVITGSHKKGIIGDGHMITEKDIKNLPNSKKSIINTNPGDVVFFDTRILHRSGVNKTNKHRRAINVILFQGKVKHLKTNNYYPVLFGNNALEPLQIKELKQIPELNII